MREIGEVPADSYQHRAGETKSVTDADRRGQRWISWTLGVWVVPACMMVIWGNCYATVFEEPGPYYPWSVTTLDSLFGLNFVVLAVYLGRSLADGLMLTCSLAITVLQGHVTFFIWSFGGASVAGYF